MNFGAPQRLTDYNVVVLVEPVAEAGRLLADHWAPVFSGGPRDEQAQQRFLDKVVRLDPNSSFDWPLGRVRNRSISDNIIELKGTITIYSQCAGRTTAGLLLDFAKAFLSLDHDFMWAVLRTMGLRASIVSVVQLLYYQLVTQILYKGRVPVSHPIASGIKQGCPLSGTLFALSLDPLIRYYLMEITLRSSVICAFADDLGLVLLNIFLQLPVVLNIFALWAAAKGLRLKGGQLRSYSSVYGV